ncbi:MAG: hypothetical protein H6667_24640 [Ardenticatenaceae bacterium]|nr:hypothetical protein [Ardenticatenaceae bacterium]
MRALALKSICATSPMVRWGVADEASGVSSLKLLFAIFGLSGDFEQLADGVKLDYAAPHQRTSKFLTILSSTSTSREAEMMRCITGCKAWICHWPIR